MSSITKTQLDILGLLLTTDKPQSIRGIAKELKKSYSLTYNNLKDLQKREIIYKKDIPPAQIIELNKNAPTEIFIEAENELKRKFLKKHKWMQVFLNNLLADSRQSFFILIVFGSYSKGKQNKNSDLDLLAIVPSPESVDKMESALNKIYTQVKKHVVIITSEQFVEMIKKPEELNVGNEAKQNHLLLYGTEQYYQLIRWKN
ncbi:MAG: nucleotidyltransferase domain-containing protein [Candidatus Woesearchaeota archaeon]